MGAGWVRLTRSNLILLTFSLGMDLSVFPAGCVFTAKKKPTEVGF
ncbi:hypothetical protein ALP27_00280 [Pseudomonas savastanoi pv. glycinea]|nr:hypothetical protein ALP27_00280 [Pseudomonas savastanoi pv. glycinea]